MKYRYLTIILFLLVLSLSILAQEPVPSDPGTSGSGAGVGSSVPLDGGLLLGLLAGGSALSTYLFKRKKKEE